MANARGNPEIDLFLSGVGTWQDEFFKLREIILACELTEELKWGVPCYSFQKHNVVLIHGFKEYCAILFFKGALLRDEDGILIRQSENVQAARQVRFTNVDEISELENTLKAYIHEAIDVEKSGLKVKFKKTEEFPLPDEFTNKLNENPELRRAFESLTPGRQRAYALFFSQAKQAKTREARVEKCMPRILAGKGLSD